MRSSVAILTKECRMFKIEKDSKEEKVPFPAPGEGEGDSLAQTPGHHTS